MIYTESTKKALKLLFEKHKNQVDKAGIPYVFHPFHVAECMDDEDSTVVALLHDIVEDTDITFEDLKNMGFNDNVIEALKLLTHTWSVNYFDYIKNISQNDIATKVKLADLSHNSDLTRLDNVTKRDIKRVEKYKKCIEYLNNINITRINFELILKSSIVGFVIGDALGVPFEFKKRNELKNKKNEIRSMVGYGTHNVPEGAWSDDSSLLLATMDSIINKGMIDYKDIMDRFCDWYLNANYTATNELFDVGISTGSSILKYIDLGDINTCGRSDINSNGNGSLMRILPVAFYLNKSNLTEEEKVEIINKVSSLTHAHEISRLGCLIYCDYINLLLNFKNKKIAYNILKTIDYSKYYSKESIKAYDNLLKKDISKFRESFILSSGYVVSTLESAIWSILNYDTFESTVLGSIMLGDDTDTIGAITGGLAGILYGYESIPKMWIDKLKRYDYIEKMCKEYSKVLNDPKKVYKRYK